MKKQKTYFIILFLIAFSLPLLSQNEWIREYCDNINCYDFQVIETYDHGYLIGAHTMWTNQGLIKDGLLIKTDINGEVLWEKIIGGGAHDYIDGNWIAQTYDGGYILLSGTYNYSHSRSDVFIMKLNACGEREWCKAFVDPNTDQYPYGVVQMSDSSYLMRIQYWGDDLNHKRIWLFKISPQGNIVWEKVYANWQPQQTNNEEGYNLIKKNDNEYLMTGIYYHNQPGQDSTIGFERPLWIAIDSTGNELWHTFWGIDDFYVGESYKSAFNTRGDIYSVGRNSSAVPSGDQAALFKLDGNGSQLYTANIPDSTLRGIATTIAIAGDSLLFIGSSYADANGDNHDVIFKTDTLGNIMAQRELLQTESTFTSSLITYNNKLILNGSFVHNNRWTIYLWKFDMDLNYDTVYTRPFTYDSLCPYPIVSDTILLDTTYVNIAELYKNLKPMSLYPNPVKEHLRVEINIVKGEKRLLRATNLAGKTVFTAPVLPGRANLTVDVSTWPLGLYVFSLYEKGAVVQAEKVLITR